MILFKIIRLLVHIAIVIGLLCCLALAMAGCQKVDASYLNTDRRTGFYQMRIDHHSLDTSKIYGRYKQDLGYLVPAEAIKVERAGHMWYINCATMDTLEHLYYLRDGVIIP
jgi:hypothetical protein